MYVATEFTQTGGGGASHRRVDFGFHLQLDKLSYELT